MPTSVQQDIASAFIARHDVATEPLPPAIQRRMVATGNQTVNKFRGIYQGSEKEPDALFKYRQENGNFIFLCVVEIGFSETYEELVEDIKIWIEGTNEVQTVVLIKLEEIPSYICPTQALQEEEIDALGSIYLSDLQPNMVTLDDKADIFGPLRLCNLTWVGRMRAFLEIWKSNATNREAERQGNRRVHLISTLC